MDPAGVAEVAEGDPVAAAAANARRKAQEVAGRRPGETVLGADTVVALDGRILPKPGDAAQAGEWLRLLSGRAHQVVGAVCVLGPDVDREHVEVSDVTFRELSDADVEEYVTSGEWRERAGGYAIQGAGGRLVANVTGSYDNVVGLPIEALRPLLADP